jgi:hypothetical protein
MWSFQDPLRVTIEQVVYFHDYLIIVIIIVIGVVRYFMVFALIRKSYASRIVADHIVERV